ncbi:MAG: GNAT family N-acetyltransferase [Clostridia bacterium]|nr:GNAT family N-acetyltransferase [Clostridia bacterium]
MKDLRLRKSAKKDSMRIEELVEEYNFQRVPLPEGKSKEEELICQKAVDEKGNIIGGCNGYAYPWGCVYIDTLWVDEKFRGKDIGSAIIEAVEKTAKEKGLYISFLDTGDFQARPFYEKHGYTLFSTYTEVGGHEDYMLFKRLDREEQKEKPAEIDYKIEDGSEEDAEYLDDQLGEFCKEFVPRKHDYIKINRKFVDGGGKVVAAIMAGVQSWDAGAIWNIWVDEEYRGQGLGTALLKHYEKKAKENGANTVVIEQVYDWNVDFFVKAGYKITGAMKDFPKGHSYYALQKFL